MWQPALPGGANQFPGGSIKGSRFVLGGWHRKNGNAELFIAVIFNNLIVNEQRKAHEPSFIESPTVDTKFLYSLGTFRPVEFPHLVRVDSPGMKQDWVEEQMRVLRIVMSNQGGERAIIRPCVDVACQAAGWTNPISKDPIVATLKKTGEFTTAYLPGNDTEEGLVPDAITPRGATTQGRIETILSGDEVYGTFRAKGLKR